MAARGIPCAQDDHAAFGQAARRRHRIGEALVICHEDKKTRIEAAELSC
jgi:hypothetical protein